MKLICNNYRCDCYIQGSGGKKIVIVGAKEDIEIAKQYMNLQKINY